MVKRAAYLVAAYKKSLAVESAAIVFGAVEPAVMLGAVEPAVVVLGVVVFGAV